MSVLKDARQKAGCDTEEFWFHQRDRELIEKMKNKPQLRLIHGGGQSRSSPPAEESQSSSLREDSGRKKAA
jgi:hypothetical protein